MSSEILNEYGVDLFLDCDYAISFTVSFKFCWSEAYEKEPVFDDPSPVYFSAFEGEGIPKIVDKDHAF